MVATLALSASGLAAQTRRPAPRPAVPAAAPMKREVPAVLCPSPLGTGVTTQTTYCDVMAERNPSAGILVTLPPHKGPLTLSFNLHNRHTYSEEQVKANRAYARYTATVGVLTLDNALISRAAVQSEFRNATDLVERIGGGAGPAGVKAVAPTGTEPISIVIPESEEQVSILGEKVSVDRLDGTETYSSAGRPVAIISDVTIEYHPAPPPKPAPVARKRR